MYKYSQAEYNQPNINTEVYPKIIQKENKEEFPIAILSYI